jgi:hypothetical protein
VTADTCWRHKPVNTRKAEKNFMMDAAWQNSDKINGGENGTKDRTIRGPSCQLMVPYCPTFQHVPRDSSEDFQIIRPFIEDISGNDQELPILKRRLISRISANK